MLRVGRLTRCCGNSGDADVSSENGATNSAVKWNVLPWPGSLSSHILPAIISTSRTEIVQTQAGAAVFPRRRGIGLRESLENHLLFLQWNADPVILDRKAQHILLPSDNSRRTFTDTSPSSVN